MPIQVKDVEWTETNQFITITVPTRGAATKNIDVFSTNNYIKVNFPPYFYEVLLFEEVEDDESKATIHAGELKFNLKKKEKKMWGQLYSDQQKDKEAMKDIRAKALLYNQKKEEEILKEKNTKKDQEKKFAVKEQINLDGLEKDIIKRLKDEETEDISKDMENWKSGYLKGKNNEGDGNLQESYDDMIVKDEKTQINQYETLMKNDVFKDLTNNTSSSVVAERKEKKTPAPRSGGSIQVNFTPRVLATPARESKRPEEEAWLSKVSEYNKMKEVNQSDMVDIEEANPIWLKDKGDDFYKKGNFVAAINAYTSALILDSKIPMIYANRAACHLSLKQYRECVQDCTCALDLYCPPVVTNALSRCRALTRRGTAFFELEEYADALRDYEDAVKLDPKNKALRNDSKRIREIIEGD